ncbi:MAG: ABC transporter permease subunit, partial [Chloroflexaceae bacterium]|nr:ABC transporter permease subunit [Chloroflexaceae bacterium]
MNTLRIQTIIDKEWAEVFKNRLVLFIVLALPLLLTVLPLAILAGAPGLTAPDGNISDLPPSMLRACGPLTPGECLQVYIVNQFLTLFMIMPLFIPITIAAYSVVGEKTTRSLEPLLATPITTEELLAGKGLAAVIPAVLATWLGFAIFVAGVLLLRAPPAVVLNLFSP